MNHGANTAGSSESRTMPGQSNKSTTCPPNGHPHP
jgi:hypothetical protein